MTQKNFYFSCVLLAMTTCALSAWRYSTGMQTANELPKDLDTAHEVIVTQSGFIKELAEKNEKLDRRRYRNSHRNLHVRARLGVCDNSSSGSFAGVGVEIFDFSNSLSLNSMFWPDTQGHQTWRKAIETSAGSPALSD